VRYTKADPSFSVHVKQSYHIAKKSNGMHIIDQN